MSLLPLYRPSAQRPERRRSPGSAAAFCQPLLIAGLVLAGAAAWALEPQGLELGRGAAAPGPDGSSAALAQDTAPALTLEQAQALAWDGHPGLRAARHAWQASAGAVLQSQARPNPELAYSQEDTRSQSRTVTVQLSQALELGGKRQARMEVAQRGQELAQAELGAAQAGLRADVSTAFFAVLAAQQRLVLAQQMQDIARGAREAAGKRVAAGKIAPLEETKARVAESGAQLEYAQAQSALRVARSQLQALWGDTVRPFGRVEGVFDALPEVPNWAFLQQRLEQAPALLRARHALAQSRAMADLERARRLPDPTLSLGVKRDQEVGRNQVVLGVSVALPVFDSNRGNQLQALRLADQAESQLQATRVQLQAQLLEARELLASSREQAQQIAGEVLPAARSAFALAERGFALGKFAYLDVLDAQRTWSEARSLYLERLLATHRASADIDRLLGLSSDL